MKHESELYQHTGIEEWLLYYRWIPKFARRQLFSLSLVSEENTLIAAGSFVLPRALGLELELKGFGRTVTLSLQGAKTASWFRRAVGTAPLEGPVFMDGEVVGECLATPGFYPPEGLMMRISSKPLGWKLEMHKSQPQLVSCPLIVEGIPNAEMVLEDYYMLGRKRQKMLPDSPKRRHFVGSVRVTQYCAVPFGGTLEAIEIIVAVAEILIKPHFMRIEAT